MSFWTSFLSYVESCDMISMKPNLRIQDKKRYTTGLGGFLSILIYILVLLSFFYFGKEIYLKRYPQLNVSNEYLTGDDEPVRINYDNLWIMFFFKGKDDNYLENYDKLLNITGILREENQTIVKNKKLSNFVKKCSEINELSEIFNSSLITYMNNDLLIKGLCVLDIELSEMIQERILYSKSLKINFDFTNSDVNSIEIFYSKIINYDLSSNTKENINFYKYESRLNHQILKKINLKLERTNIFSDNGLILTDNKSENYSQIESINEQVLDLKKSNNVSFDVDISLSLMKKTVYRQYLKIQLLLATVGGITKAFVVMAFCLNFVHNNTLFYQNLISEIFDLKDLRKNFQFYESDTKNYFKKYRNSIALRRVKEFEYLKREMTNSNMSIAPTRHNNYLSNIKGPTTDLNYANNYHINPAERINKSPNLLNNEIVSNNNYESENSENIISKSISENINNLDQLQNNLNTEIKYSSKKKDYYNRLMSPVNLKNNTNFKLNFDKIKTERFHLNFVDIFKVHLCCKSKNNEIQKNILESGKYLINQRLDLVNLLKKMLDFDRFKNLVLKDYQLILLNSLSRHLLDPETIDVVDFKNITFEKLTDAISEASKSNNVIDHNLTEFIKLKYELD